MLAEKLAVGNACNEVRMKEAMQGYKEARSAVVGNAVLSVQRDQNEANAMRDGRLTDLMKRGWADSGTGTC